MICATSLLALMLSLSIVPGARAQGAIPDCANGVCEINPNSGEVAAQIGAFLKPYTTTSLHGGYVAHGVGMRNLGYGFINIADLPPGATISKAYLFWAVIGPKSMKVPDPNPLLPAHVYNYAKGKFDGHNITGTLVGSGAPPCWGGDPIWGYRADVHSYVTSGTHNYFLSGFASGKTNADDPFVVGSPAPMVDGATLVILFTKAGYPTTTIKIYNGMASTIYDPLHQTITGINAVAPTGFAYTTFIVADGQNNFDFPGSTKLFFDSLPAVWSGADPNGNGVSYSRGNLWDTVTVDVHKLLKPPEPDFWFTTYDSNGASADCVSWEAQVVAYSSGNVDSDGDKFLDNWELNGYNGMDMQALGANPLHKDLFVEADYMNNGGNLLPPKAQLDDIVAVFNAAPISNPDGITGIHIHIDTGGADATHVADTYPAYDLGGGGQVPLQANLGVNTPGCVTYDWGQFQAVKDANFAWYRQPVFHYMVFANNLAPCMGTVSGISRNGDTDAAFIKGATDFIVSLGGWGSHGTAYEREGTFIHEFGHNLGLRHGGNDHKNYKPNYLSVMNYFFQTTGVYRSGSWYNFDYSRFQLPTLNEASLNENSGLGPLAVVYGTKWYCPSPPGGVNTDYTASSSVDWNCNGVIAAGASVDINNDGSKTSLGTQNNWANITFSGNGMIGTGASAATLAANSYPSTKWIDELTSDMVAPAP